MAKYLFIGNAESIRDFIPRLSLEISQWYLKDICLFVSNGQAEVKNIKTGESLTGFRKVIVMSAPENKYPMLSAIGCFARKNGIDMIDDSFPNTSGKLYEAFRLNEENLSIPETASGPVEFLKQKLADFGGQAVLKAEHGTKGRDNYLVKTPEEIEQIVTDETDFVLQKYIPNYGDWRVIVLKGVPKYAFLRSSETGNHLNNTSQGGKIEVIKNPNPAIIDLAVKASNALGIQFAGADIIENRETGELSVLEVNRTPQFASSAVPESLKVDTLKNYLES